MLSLTQTTWAAAGKSQYTSGHAAGRPSHTQWKAQNPGATGRPASKAVSQFSVVSTHPRVWLTPARLVRLRAEAGQNSVLWQRVKAQADKDLSYQPPANDPNDGVGGLPVLGLAYQITGDTAYAQKAIQILMVACVSSNDANPDRSFWSFRNIIPDVTAGYDWCYAALSPAQRTQIADWLMDRAYDCWPETNPTRVNGWSVYDPGNNYFWGMMTTWPAALAAYGDDPRAASEIQYNLARHYSLVVPFAQGWGRAGVFAEGTGYDGLFNMSMVYDAQLTATGQDFINDPSFPFLKNSLLWRIYQSTPGEVNQYYYGDQSRVFSAPMYDMDFLRGVIVVGDTNDATLASYGQSWLNRLTANGVAQDRAGNEAWEFLWYNPGISAVDYKQELPTAFSDAAGTGLLVQRSSWQDDATYWGTWAGPLQASHQFNDVNGFVIWKGNYWLTGSCNMWGYNGIYNDTLGQNNLTFGGGQFQQGTQTPTTQFPTEAGRVLKQEVTDQYTYTAGQGANAYVQRTNGGGTTIATDYVRKIVYLNPDTFLIYDRATVANPAWSKEWHLQSGKPISIDGRTYRFDNGQYQITGQSLLPASGTTLQNVPFGVTSNGSPTSYCLDVVTNNNQATDYLLNVLQITPVGQAAPFQPVTLAGASANVDAVLCGSWVVALGRSEKITDPVTYSVSAVGPLEHLVLDLVPSLRYTVAQKDLATGAVTTSVLTATASGSLRFSSPGDVQIRISTSDAVPCSISGRVYNIATSAGVADATVSVGGKTATTDLSGLYTVTGLTPGTYTVTPSKEGYLFSLPRTVKVGPDATGVDFAADTSQETYHINSGGNNFVAADGTYWLSDRFFQGGVAHTYATIPILGATDAGLLYDVLNSRGDFKYVFPAVAGNYTVKLHFLETDTSVTGTGQRLFNVTINGTPALTSYDVYATAGPNVAVTKSFPATAGADGVEVDFHTVSYAAMVSAIELLPGGVGPTPTTYSLSGTVTAAGRGLAGVTLTAGGQSATTAADGTYTVNGLAAGSYTASASLSGYAFSGPQSVTVGPSKTGVNFTATQNAPTAYSISGTVTAQGAGLAGATVSAGSQSATTAADGTYTLSGLGVGTYSVSAALSGYSVSGPQSVTVGPSKTGVNFSATTVVASSSVLRVNCGGGAYTDASGAAWQADAGFSGGAAWQFPASGLAGTPDPALDGSVRYDYAGFAYKLPAAAGAYTLRLHFIEGDAGKAAPGARVFDVAVNGAPALSGLDVCRAAGGVGRPLVETLPVTSDGGGVTVAFAARNSSAMVSAIELVPAGSAAR